MDSRKNSIITALMVAMFLGAVEGTVVTTAVPSIVKSLNGFELISWVFSAYMLTSAISTPVYGKLSDLYGRKLMLSIAISIFLLGSFLCGFSTNMYLLIFFRALQGLGAGGIFTISYTIVGDVFTLAERAKVQGWLSSVWGIASLVGPFLGGFFIDYLSWNWIFFINIPFGILCIILLQKNLQESFEKKSHKIDYIGTITLSFAILFILLSILFAEKSHSLFSNNIIVCLIISISMLVLFCKVEKKAEEPIIPFEIFTKTNTVTNIIGFLASAVLIGCDVYMPIYIQNILGKSATISGLSLAPMSISWLVAAVVLGKAITKYGERTTTIFSFIVLIIGSVLLATLGANSPLFLSMTYTFILGAGFGGAFTIITIIVQSSVEFNMRGAATASNTLLRTLGQTIGVSVFGSMFNLSIINYFSKIGITNIDPNNLYTSAEGKIKYTVDSVINSQISGIKSIFFILVIISVVCLVLSFMLPNKLKKINDINQD
ncbi:MDR family MFS transporter [Clostridium fungisolvens]|uniref:Multidrug resistance protein 3 n=1 Tax=Clostridium fungisolvens TaxID=1604897 RepID=A0A6V8SHG0_9CLOT|nr:MDR family MFS transporter [Clostridium fungisolvens]GFP76032.1 Multidrug resistance protein 3 [Clostridium fungisolvens]